jgi:crotonobetainyl-CoA:carnitine CoA-transferase CaiB-like acyl-CoA transferase
MPAFRPLEGLRMLSMEQAAALPFATRHLADLGAEVIRVESPLRRGGLGEADLYRDKRRFGIDLGVAGAPEVFLRVAAGCDVVAHNFTPRVMRKYGIDFEGVRAVNPDVIYVSLTGFGTTGPWGERPLFGPGAEAVSAFNVMIGEPGAWPGRPGTIVYADNTCGMNAAFAILAALDERERTGHGQHIDISLYETAVAHIGAAVAERAFGGPLSVRIGNVDANFALHGVFATAGRDRHVAIAATAAQIDAVALVLGVDGVDAVDAGRIAAALAARDADEVADALQVAGVAAAAVADAAAHSADPHLWARGYFGVIEQDGDAHPHAGPAWGGGAALRMVAPHHLGEDNDAVLRDAGYTDAEIEALAATGVVGAQPSAPARVRADDALRIERGELARVDARHDGWRAARDRATR